MTHDPRWPPGYQTSHNQYPVAQTPPPRPVQAPGRAPVARLGKVPLLFLVLGTLLLPVGIIGFWSQQTLTDTPTFTETVSPLVEDPLIQQEIIDAVSGAVIDGASGTGVPVDRIRGTVREITGQIVRSQEFQQVFTSAVEQTHATVITVLSESSGSPVAVDGRDVVLNLNEARDRVQAALARNGINLNTTALADASIRIAPAEDLQRAQSVYSVSQPVLQWFFVIPLVLLILAVLVSRNRPRATIGVGIACLTAVVLLGIGWIVGRTVTSALTQGSELAEATPVAYGIVTGQLVNIALIVAVTGLVLLGVGWFWGRSARPGS